VGRQFRSWANGRTWSSAASWRRVCLRHFEWLLGRKTLFSYGQRGVDPMELLVAKTRMEQFFAWASRAFPEVARL
jgi:hypothetical protein